MTANSSASAASTAASPDRTKTSSWSSDDKIASSASRFSARSSTSRIFARCATAERATSVIPAVATGARGLGHVVVLPVAIVTYPSLSRSCGTYRRSSRATPLTSSVNIPAAQKDRIDADIQLAGVNPMSRPNEDHADAHQDTYPGLMSW